MRYADIKKTSEDERQNQTTTTNINYIKKFMSVLKKQNLITKSKYRQIKLKINKITCNSAEKMVICQFIIKPGNN